MIPRAVPRMRGEVSTIVLGQERSAGSGRQRRVRCDELRERRSGLKKGQAHGQDRVLLVAANALLSLGADQSTPGTNAFTRLA